MELKNGSLSMKIIKLVLGAFFFVALCVSGILSLIFFFALFEREVNVRHLLSFLGTAGVFLVSSVVLYYLSREIPTVETSEIAKTFKTRKLVFQVSVIGLIAVFIVAIASFAGGSAFPGVEATIISALFFGIYFLLARRLWRCPACESRLPFGRQEKATQAIKFCPSCKEQLQ